MGGVEGGGKGMNTRPEQREVTGVLNGMMESERVKEAGRQYKAW